MNRYKRNEKKYYYWMDRIKSKKIEMEQIYR